MPQTALDLTKDVPRSPFVEVAGYVWLPRLIDKARAYFAGTNGEYAAYPCGMDRAFIGFYQLDTDALAAEIKAGKDEHEIASWVRQHQAPRSPEEVAAFKRRFLLTPPEEPELLAFLTQLREGVAPGRTELDTFAKVICFEEKHPIPTSV